MIKKPGIICRRRGTIRRWEGDGGQKEMNKSTLQQQHPYDQKCHKELLIVYAHKTINLKK